MNSALKQIKLMLKNKIGLDSSTIGDATIEKIILQRMQQCDLCEFQDYLQLIQQNQQELNTLLEISVIPETWFFRDIKPYEFIYNQIQKTLLNNKSTRFKILSIPCSTGEEPYSLTMYLIEKGLNASTFLIDAVDVSQRALQLADKAIYGENSFRGKHYHLYKKKYFSYDNKQYLIQQKIRDSINFYPLNILHNQQAIKYPFDFILCRNLLIYFDSDTKQLAFNNLSKLLKDDGHLFVGHSEFGSVPEDIFYNTGFEKAFALIKHSHPQFEEKKQIYNINAQVNNAAVNDASSTHKDNTKKTNFETLINKTDTSTGNEEKNILIKVRDLVNLSELTKAEAICHQHIEKQGEDADVLYFLGLISDSQNNLQAAEDYYRKSIYLNPKHYESLINLSLLLEKNGDLKSSALFKKRAERSFLNPPNESIDIKD